MVSLRKYIRQSTCKHVFSGKDMGRRDSTGWLDWPCCKCGKVYRVEYGLQITDYGKITGPWGVGMQEVDEAQARKFEKEALQNKISAQKDVLRKLVVDNCDKELLTKEQLDAVLFFIRYDFSKPKERSVLLNNRKVPQHNI